MGFDYLFTKIHANTQSSILLNVYQTSTFTSSKHQFHSFVCSTILFDYVLVVRTQIKVLKVLTLNRSLDKMIHNFIL